MVSIYQSFHFSVYFIVSTHLTYTQTAPIIKVTCTCANLVVQGDFQIHLIGILSVSVMDSSEMLFVDVLYVVVVVVVDTVPANMFPLVCIFQNSL